MTKKFLNKLMMIKAVLTLLNRNKNVWNKVQDTVTDVNELETLVVEIEEIQKFTSEKNDGQTDVKEAEQKKLIRQTFNLASALTAMAERTNDSVLLAKVDFPVSDLERKRDQNQLITAQMVAKLTRENLEALASAAITEEQVTGLEAQIEVYSQCMPAKRASTVEMKAANAKIGDLFKQTDKLFKKRLDKMMVRYEISDPGFYAAYQSARQIVDYGTRYEKETSGEQVSEEI